MKNKKTEKTELLFIGMGTIVVIAVIVCSLLFRNQIMEFANQIAVPVDLFMKNHPIGSAAITTAALLFAMTLDKKEKTEEWML